MKYTFQMRGKPVTVAPIRDVAAVMPTTERRAGMAKSKLAGLFGTLAVDDTRGGGAGMVLPSRNRKLFESAGWVFVEPQQAIARAAVSRAAIEGADAVRQVYLGRSGTLVGTDRLTVSFEPDITDAEAKQRIKDDGLRVVRRLEFAGLAYEVRIPSRRPELEVVQELQALGNRYRFVEPVFLEALAGRMTPTDPHYGDQWQHSNNGSNGGVLGADIKSEKAWDANLGAGVRVAVIDNGMQVNHPDLKAGIMAGGYFQNGAVGTATFVRWTPGTPGFPNGSHGTSCLGMVGARHNNGRGGCGSAPLAEMIPIACLSDQIGTQLTLARAIAYAADPTTEDATATAGQGAHVISCSLGPNGADWDMQSILDLAIERAATQGRGGLGVPIFWAATNGPYDISLDEVCSHPRVVAVSRSNRLDLEDGAGYGDNLAFLAPGVDVYTTISGSSYDFVTGCSFSAPLAAGVAALVLERYPGWTRDQVVNRLFGSCDKIGGVVYDAVGRHPEYGYGRINAERAVQ